MNRSVLALLACLALVAAGCGDSSSGPGDGNTDTPGDDGGNNGGNNSDTPTVTGIHPVGAGPGSPVTITGTNFSVPVANARHPGLVYLGGSYPATITDWSDTEIVFLMPDVPGNWVKVEIAFEDEVVDAGFMGSWEEGVIQLTNTGAGTGAGAPTWTVDGAWIWYVQHDEQEQQYDLWRVPSTGGVPERMTHTPYDEQWPDIQFSSGAVAFGRNATTNGNAAGDYDIWIAQTFQYLSPADPNHATQDLLDRAPSWSRDVQAGIGLAWDTRDGSVSTIYLRDNGVPTPLTTGTNPRFNPIDGDWIVCADTNVLTPYLLKVRISTGDRTPLGTPNEPRGAADWGVNHRIVYDSGDGSGNIWVMDEDGNNQELLIGTPDLEYAPRWSPTADRVAFASHRFGSFNAFVYTLPEAREAVAR
jgi:IPT/TIG domain